LVRLSLERPFVTCTVLPKFFPQARPLLIPTVDVTKALSF